MVVRCATSFVLASPQSKSACWARVGCRDSTCDRAKALRCAAAMLSSVVVDGCGGQFCSIASPHVAELSNAAGTQTARMKYIDDMPCWHIGIGTVHGNALWVSPAKPGPAGA